MTPLEALTYLLDPTFTAIVALSVALVVALNAIDRIGGHND